MWGGWVGPLVGVRRPCYVDGYSLCFVGVRRPCYVDGNLLRLVGVRRPINCGEKILVGLRRHPLVPGNVGVRPQKCVAVVVRRLAVAVIAHHVSASYSNSALLF